MKEVIVIPRRNAKIHSWEEEEEEEGEGEEEEEEEGEKEDPPFKVSVSNFEELCRPVFPPLEDRMDETLRHLVYLDAVTLPPSDSKEFSICRDSLLFFFYDSRGTYLGGKEHFK